MRRNLREEKLKELRTRGGFGAMRFPYLAIRQSGFSMIRGGDLEEHQPMDVQRGAGQSAGGDEGGKKLKRVAKDFPPSWGSKAVSIESCASSKAQRWSSHVQAINGRWGIDKSQVKAPLQKKLFIQALAVAGGLEKYRCQPSPSLRHHTRFELGFKSFC
jgi:hypothetical protein